MGGGAGLALIPSPDRNGLHSHPKPIVPPNPTPTTPTCSQGRRPATSGRTLSPHITLAPAGGMGYCVFVETEPQMTYYIEVQTGPRKWKRLAQTFPSLAVAQRFAMNLMEHGSCGNCRIKKAETR